VRGDGAFSAAYIGAMMTLSFMTGVVQLAMGLVRAGAITTFLGDTVIAAFTTGSAILIMSSQVSIRPQLTNLQSIAKLISNSNCDSLFHTRLYHPICDGDCDCECETSPFQNSLNN
jgi:MFS superfamily sulfate permease-like transporter